MISQKNFLMFENQEFVTLVLIYVDLFASIYRKVALKIEVLRYLVSILCIGFLDLYVLHLKKIFNHEGHEK